jgi:hypothetical protein
VRRKVRDAARELRKQLEAWQPQAREEVVQRLAAASAMTPERVDDLSEDLRHDYATCPDFRARVAREADVNLMLSLKEIVASGNKKDRARCKLPCDRSGARLQTWDNDYFPAHQQSR